jgi:hypothetical protein
MTSIAENESICDGNEAKKSNSKRKSTSPKKV